MMAPFSEETRDGLAEVARQTPDQIDSPDPLLHNLEITSLTLATVSVVAALLAFYWFVRMRRSFRQDLIMLLIQSDMFKAFWLMVPPVYYFVRGPFESSNIVCQISGFLFNSATEASDIAVLMIAIHSGMYILRPQRSDGDAGLYPYRRWAYAAWVVIPLIMAAIVPATGSQYVIVGSVCTIPTSPMWYRTALSWGPRYIIFAIIIATYSFLYFYLWWEFRNLEKDQRRASIERRRSSVVKQPRSPNVGEAPQTPSFDRRALVDTTFSSSAATSATQSPLPRPKGDRADALRLDASSTASESQEKAERTTTNSDRAETSEPADIELQQHHGSNPSNGATSSPQRPLRAFMFHDMRRTISIPEAAVHEPSDGASIYLTQSVTGDVLHRSRKAMRRQLRLLFIYPLVYIITWIAPFVAHAYRLNDFYDADIQSPYALLAASTASLCLSAAVDCCFFMAWEKPWRHVQGGFWEGMAYRVRIRGLKGRLVVGRTRDEQLRDAGAARRRREREVADQVAMGGRSGQRGTREWWEVEGSRPMTPESVERV